MSAQAVKTAAMKVALTRINALVPTVQVAWPNKKFTPPAGAWLSVFYLPAGEEVTTAGGQGEQELLAILQIDVNIPTNTGDKIQNTILTAFESYFTPGKRFTFAGQTIRFLACNRSSGRIVENSWRVSLSINLSGRYFRPSLT